MRYSLLYAASAVTVVSQALDKPVISPEFPGGGLDSLDDGLNNNLAIAGQTYTRWDDGMIPQDCRTITESAGFQATDVDTLEITYNDCQQPWQMCRHRDSPLSEQTIVDTFGRLPVHFRQFVRHMVFVPGNPSAGSNGDNVQMNGELGITVFVHETAHSVDSNGYPDIGQFSMSQIWLDAYNADSAVTDAYAQVSQQENFAQQTVCALYQTVVPEGLGPIQPNFQAISNQFGVIQEYSQDIIVPGGECTQRLENSPPVPQAAASAKFRKSRTVAEGSLAKGIKIIKPTPMKETMEIHSFKDGKVVGSKTQHLKL